MLSRDLMNLFFFGFNFYGFFVCFGDDFGGFYEVFIWAFPYDRAIEATAKAFHSSIPNVEGGIR